MSNIAETPKTRKNWINQFVSPGGQHLASRRCMKKTQFLGPERMSRLLGPSTPPGGFWEKSRKLRKTS